MTDEGGFLRAILSDPSDPAARLVYADWLEERGDDSLRRAEYLRLSCRLDTLPSSNRSRRRLQARLRQLRKVVGVDWRRQVDGAKAELRVAVLRAAHCPGWSGALPCARQWVTTHRPTWGDIECALLRLDRGEWPCLQLLTTPLRGDEPPEECFDVIGGQDEYALRLQRGGRVWCPHGPSRGEDLVWVSESGQEGPHPRSVLCGLNDAATAARHYAETRELWPGLPWVEMPTWPPV